MGGGRFVVPFCERVQIELIVITTLLSLQSFRIGGLLPPLYPVMPHNGPTTLSLCRSSLLSVGWAKGEGLVTYRVAVGQCSISRSLSLSLSLFLMFIYLGVCPEVLEHVHPDLKRMYWTSSSRAREEEEKNKPGNFVTFKWPVHTKAKQ